MTSRTPFLALPDEILEEIVAFLPAVDLARAGRTSKRIYAAASQKLLWRTHCCQKYSYWSSEHSIRDKLSTAVADTNWKQLYARRQAQDRVVSNLLEEVLSSQTQRIPRIEKIYNYGNDAKDALFEHIDCPDDAEDVLARRYWASQILGSLDRITALVEVQKLCRNQQNYPIERALGLFDLLLVENVPYGLDDISRKVDAIADVFKAAHEDYKDWDTRTKALQLQDFLRLHKYTQTPQYPTEFWKIRRRLIGVSLFDSDHAAIPLISGGIYCAVAARLDLDAYLNNFPHNVMVTVKPPTERTLDGKSQEPNCDKQIMILEPGGTGQELSLSSLKSTLTMWGDRPEFVMDHLAQANLVSLMVRMCKNLRPDGHFEHEFRYETVFEDVSPSFPVPPDRKATRRRDLRPSALTPPRATFSAAFVYLTAFTSTQPRLPSTFAEHRMFLQPLVVGLRDFFHNCWHVERFVLAGLGLDARTSLAIAQILAEHRAEDATPPPVKRRRAADVVRYRIGDVFLHRRFHYVAAVVGWDPTCQQEEQWIETMGVDRLSDGREQGFYNALSDRDYYVASQNVRPLTGPSAAVMPGTRIMSEAGRYFKRFDEPQGRFVSNLRDEYPDD